MPLEPATYISDLNISNPTAGDGRNQGDDHIRLIKSAIKNTFPSLNAAITVTATELNRLSGVTSNVQTQISGIIPAGTKMPFYQASPPSGWTAVTVQNDSMMRVVTSGTTGGSSDAGAGHSPILNNVIAGHTHTFSATTGTESVTHTHAMNSDGRSVAKRKGADGIIDGTSSSSSANDADYSGTQDTGAASVTHTHGVSGTTATNSGAANWQPRYMDFCVGQKT